MAITTQLAFEVAHFFASRPTLEQIIDFHPSAEAAERFYELVETEREGTISDAEREELDTAIHLEFMVDMIKAEAHKQLALLAS